MKRIFVSISICALAMAVWATGEVNRDVTVERDYNPVIEQAPKQTLTPQKENLKPDPLPVKYNQWTQPEQVQLEPNMQKPMGQELGRSYDYKKGMARVGFGFYLQTLGEFYYPLLQGKNYLLDFSALHRSNWSKISLPDGTKPRGMSNFTDIALNYEHQFTGVRLAMKAGYAYTGYDYYGMSTEPVTPLYKDTVGGNSVVEVAAKLFSTNTKSSLQYEFGLEYLYLGRNFDISMHEFGFEGDVSGAAGKGRAGVALKVDVHSTNMPASSVPSVPSVTEPVEVPEGAEGPAHHPHTATILTLTPYYAVHGDEWGVKIGANLFAHLAKDEEAGHGEAEAQTEAATGPKEKWPVSGSANIEAHAAIVPQLFYLYGGIGGDYSSNDYYHIVRENKYITPNLSVKPTYTPLDLDLGLKVRIMKGLLLDASFNYQIRLNQYYYVNHVHQSVNPATQLLEDDYYTNTFDVVYEPTTHKISAGAALHFDYVSGLDITAHMQYNLWSVSEQAYAWHKPAWEVGVKGTYHFLEKWEVGASYTFLGGRMALVQNQAVAMNDVHDVNLWASYQALDWLTVFVEGKNLANIQSDTYYGYRSFGINAIAGATFRF
jgi:hypothetical protein